MEIKPIALNSLKWATKSFLQDLQALPEEAFDKKFGEKTRTVADIVHEVNLVNDHIGLTIRGEELWDWPEGWIFAPEDQRTKDTVIAAFERSSLKMIETIESFSEEQMLETIESEGKETNRFERCRFMSWHLGYHSGQLNYIQTLMGDDGWHWR